MTHRAIGVLALAACGVFGVAGCAQDDSQAGASPALVRSSAPYSASPSASAAATPSAPPAPPALDDDGPTEAATPATPDPASADQALVRATAFMRAFARTDLSQQLWWDGVSGYFTPAAGPVYQSTDVANVPVHHVVDGSAKALPGTTKYRAQVTVDTDNGTYTVVLIRANDDWLVDRATPPRP